MNHKTEPVRVMASVLAGLQVLVAGTTLSEVLDPKTAALLALVVAALTSAWGEYARGQVSPSSTVAAEEPSDGGPLVAGEAAPGIPEGTQVEVRPAQEGV